MHPRAAGKKGPRSHRHVAGQHDVVGQNHVVTQAAIVGDVGVAHQQAVIADHRVMVRMHGLMDRDILADRIVRPDDHSAKPLRHTGVLGNAADHRPLEKMVPFTQRGPALDDDVAFQNALGADCHVILDHREGPNLNAVAKFCRGSDQRQRVNKHNGHLEAVEEFCFDTAGGQKRYGPFS